MASLLIHKYYPGFDNIKGIKGRVSAVYTDKDYRHKGYQTQVSKFLITKAFEMELPSIKVNSNNPVAVKLYEKVGFKKANNCYKITP